MKRVLVNAGIALTRLWVRAYTWGLPCGIGLTRRDEINSDIWEMLNDRDGRYAAPTGPSVLLRLFAGIPADVAWRVEQSSLEQRFAVRRALAFGAALALLALIWTAPLVSINGRREVTTCADQAASPHDTASLRLDVMRCAGAFFSARR
jgi:hypothetical protein